MAENTETVKTEKRRGKINKKLAAVRIAILAVIAALIVYLAVSVFKIIDLSKEKAEADAINKQLTETKEDLTKELKNVKSSQYMERLARHHLKLIREGEILFVLPDTYNSADDISYEDPEEPEDPEEILNEEGGEENEKADE